MASKPILIIQDNSLDIPEIEEPLYPSSVEEGGTANSGMSMMKINGVLVPFVKVNNRTLDYNDIMSFRLESIDFLPTMSISFVDRYGVTAEIDTPGPDNTVQIQIIPKFDGVYKKINMVFYIIDTSINTHTNTVSLKCEYTVDGMNDSKLKSYGKVDTYSFYNTVASDLKLGYCSNIDTGVTGDDRYIYQRNTSPLDLLRREYVMGGKDGIVYDAWIDFYNNINLIDLYDLFYGGANWTDQPDKLSIWSSHNMNDADGDAKIEPFEIDAILTNNPQFGLTELYTQDMKIKTSSGSNLKKGTDRGINIYDINKLINESILVQDGTGIESNIYTKTVYRGEYNPEVCDYNYLFQPELQKLFVQKLKNNMIEITSPAPVFGLMRGQKVNVEWVGGGNVYKETVEESSLETNVPISGYDEKIDINDPGSFILNKRLSGQYVIIGTEIKFKRGGNTGMNYNMTQKFILTRVVSYNDKYIK